MSGRPTCKGCQAPIRWVRTRAGKAMPVDPDRAALWIVPADGTRADPGLPRVTVITAEGETIAGWRGSVLTPGAVSVDGYTSHFATCAKAGAFRR